jgi:hypothetical protein
VIIATFPATVVTASPGTGERRTIGGVALPWGVEGTVRDGTRVRFLPGSLDAAARPVTVLGHDGPPIGRVADAANRGDRLEASVRVSQTHAGDDALVLANDGVLAMFSVEANPTGYRYDDAGVLEVIAADWVGLSLEPAGAFAGANLTTITATQGGAMPDPVATATTPDDPDTPDVPDPEPEPEPEPGVIQGAAATGPNPSPTVVPLRASSAAQPQPVTLTRVAETIAGAMRRAPAGSQAARIQAALANVTTANVAGIVRPAYRSEIVGLIDYGMPTVRVLQSRPLPSSGMRIEYPEWTSLPANTTQQAQQKTEIGTGPVTIGVKGNDIATWAQGNDISFQTAQRSDPSFIDAYLRAAAIDAGTKYDIDVNTKLLAVATAAVAGTTFLENVKALFAALAPPKKVPLGPLFLALSYDVWLDTIDVTGLDGPAYWDLSINFGSFLPDQTTDSLLTYVSPNLPAGTMLLGSRQAAASYGGPETSADIRVVDVSLLGIDLGVYFFAVLAIEYPEAFAKLTGLVSASTALVEGAQRPEPPADDEEGEQKAGRKR